MRAYYITQLNIELKNLKVKNMEGNFKRKQLIEEEQKMHEKYLELLDSMSDDELENVSYWDLIKKGITSGGTA